METEKLVGELQRRADQNYAGTALGQMLGEAVQTIQHLEERVGDYERLLREAVRKLDEAPLNQEPKAMASLFRAALSNQEEKGE